MGKTKWYIFKRRILILIWVHFWARILLLKVIYGLFEARILLLKVIYGLFGARILLQKYIRAQNWTQLVQSNIRTQKMYHWAELVDLIVKCTTSIMKLKNKQSTTKEFRNIFNETSQVRLNVVVLKILLVCM